MLASARGPLRLRQPLLLVLALAALVAAGAYAHVATAAPAAHVAKVKCNDDWPLHGGSPGHPASCGKRVSEVQWLIHTPRPKQNVLTQVHGTFKPMPNGLYGARAKAAVTAYKYRLGYPRAGQCGAKTNLITPTVGPYFVKLLTDPKVTRPACWVSLVSGRLKAIAAAEPTPAAIAWKAQLETWLGIHETSNNRGPCISTACIWKGKSYRAIQSSTGQYGAAWCVSTEQAVSLLVTGHTFADDTAGVYYAADYYAARNLTFAKAKFGSLVVFPTYDRNGNRVPGTGHMGFVTGVQTHSFSYIAGNDGNAVRQHTIAYGSRPYLFIRLPGVA